MEDQPFKSKNQKLFILAGVLILMIIIVVIVASRGENTSVSPVNNDQANNAQTNNDQAQNVAGTDKTDASTTPESIAFQDAVAVVPGASLVNKENKVITTSGEVTQTDVAYNSPLAPQQTMEVVKESLDSSVIKLDISAANGFVPNTFTVKAGAAVTISITNQESDRSAALAFTDPSMQAVIINTRPSETRAITFNAPTKAGSYQFIDGIPGHSAEGTMIVK